ncbi:hypothetical protein FRC08_015230 [Ceratobasidium sp. 394]|nr:hypothetical protein FRC08_015230 [Ceratobasidium sp. 394]KAG9088884.1 hypothetical protein FS749_001778 [Ceratobasidium sp. UAMH 11750]
MHRSRKKRTHGALAQRRPKALDLGLNLDLVLPPPPTIVDLASSSSSQGDPKQIEAPPMSPPAYFVYLPTELILRILGSTGLSRRDLVNLALVSRKVNEFVTPILYENVKVRASVLPTDASGAFLISADAQPAIPAYCLRLARDPELGQHVRTLHVSEIHKRHRPLVTCLPVMVDNMPHLHAFHWDVISGMDVESTNLILDAVRDCQELRSLRLGAKIGVNFANTDSHIQISGFQHLHDLSFRVLNSIHDDTARVIIQIITSIVGASPDLVSLDVRVPAYGSIADTLLGSPYRWARLTRVSLSGFHVPEPILAGFLTRHTGIRALRLDIRGTQSVGLAVLGVPRHSLASLRLFSGTFSNVLEIVDEHSLRRSLRDVRVIGGSWLGFGHHGVSKPAGLRMMKGLAVHRGMRTLHLDAVPLDMDEELLKATVNACPGLESLRFRWPKLLAHSYEDLAHALGLFHRLITVAVRVPDLNNVLDHSDPLPPPQVDPNPQIAPSTRRRHEIRRVQPPQQVYTLMPVHVEETDGVQTVAGWMVAHACRRLEVFHILPPVVRAGEVLKAVSGYTVRITRWAGYDLCDVEEASSADAALELEWSDEYVEHVCSG